LFCCCGNFCWSGIFGAEIFGGDFWRGFWDFWRLGVFGVFVCLDSWTCMPLTGPHGPACHCLDSWTWMPLPGPHGPACHCLDSWTCMPLTGPHGPACHCLDSWTWMPLPGPHGPIHRLIQKKSKLMPFNCLGLLASSVNPLPVLAAFHINIDRRINDKQY